VTRRHATLGLLVLGCSTLAAQERKSQSATLTQTIGGTQVTVAYNRPSARGRKLFGGVVAWGKVWCPGADEATTLTVTKDVLVAGSRSLPGSTACGRSRQPRRGP
jgi:hypothetical protein